MIVKYINNAMGFIVCVVIACAALFISSYIKIGAVSLAIILGIVVGSVIHTDGLLKSGITFAEKTILSWAIALMGVKLDFLILERLGFHLFAMVVCTLILTITCAIFIGKLMKCDASLALLLGIGNGVCGSSAIAATEEIIGARKEDVGLSITVVNCLGIVGMFALPLLAKSVFHFTDINTGVLVGNTLQAVGQVVAAGFAVSDTAGQTATIVKMTRVLMLTPLLFTLLFFYSKKRKEKLTLSSRKKSPIPLFIIGFVLFSLVKSVRVLPESLIYSIGLCSHYALIIAMAGIGLGITVKDVFRHGKSALIVGVFVFMIQIAMSTIVIAFVLPAD